MKPIHIFKTGKHTDSSGVELTFSETDLANAVAAYDPALHQAPIVVGHPKTDAPAFGWVQSLSADSGNLFASPEQVNTEFSEQVKAGSYKKVSASFYPPNSPANPVKDAYYLRHVGFLGAEPPAIKGLQPVEFSETTDAVTITLDFAESSTSSNEKQSVFEQIVTGMRSLFFGESASPLLTSPQSGEEQKPTPNPQTEPNKEDNPMGTTAPVTPPATPKPPAAPVTTDTTDKDAKIADLQAKLDAKDAADATAKSEALTKENADFSEALVNDGKIAPKDKGLVTAILDGLDTAQGIAPVEFGEGDGKKPLKQAVKDKLSNANTDSFAHLFSEAAGKPATSVTGTFEAPSGTTIDADRLAQHNEALAYSEAHKVDYTTAVIAIGG